MLSESLSVFIPLLLFVAVLIIPLPIGLLNASRYNYWLFGSAIAILFYLTFRCPGRVGRTLSLSALLITFALPLAYLWQTGASDIFVVGGILPFSDAAIYYGDARSLLNGGTIASWGPQRPLFPGLLAVLLGLFHQNLQIAIATLVLMNAIACFFVAREIQKTNGTFISVLISIQTFFFYRLFLGKTMTENLGLALGLLGFAALWRGAHQRHLGTSFAGIFFLTFALNARIGTVFVLPALVVWGTFVFRKSARFSGKFLLGSSAAILLGGALNLILLKIVGSPTGSPPFANFAFTLYGLVTHTTWFNVYTDYPELWAMDGVKRNQAVYVLATDLIRKDPMSLVTGVVRGWTVLFWGKQYSLFAWDFLATQALDPILRPLSVLGLLSTLRHWKKPTASLLLAMAIGIFLTMPLLPLWDAGNRPYAATIIVLFMFTALGLMALLDILCLLLKWLWNRLNRDRFNPLHRINVTWMNRRSRLNLSFQSPPSRWQPNALLSFGFSLVLLSFAGSIAVKTTAFTPQFPPSTCPEGLETQLFRANPGSWINLVGNDAISRSQVPNIRLRDFKRGLKTFSFWSTKEPKMLKKLKAQTTIVDTSGFWLVADTQMVPKGGGNLLACGKFIPAGKELLLFRADSIQPIAAIGQPIKSNK